MFVLAVYISFVLVWGILGAILNPAAYLYYGTAAFTLVSFVSVKITQYKELQSKGLDFLMKAVSSKIKAIMDGVLKKMLIKTDLVNEEIKDVLLQTY